MMIEGLKDLGTLPEKAKGIRTRCQRRQEKIGRDAGENKGPRHDAGKAKEILTCY